MSPTMDPLGASRPQAATTSAATGTPQQSCCWIGTLFLPWTVSSTTAEDPAGPSSQTHGFPTSNSSSPNVSFGVTSPAKFPSLKRKLTLSKMTMLPPPAPPKSTTTPLTVSQQEDSVSFSPCYFGNIGLQNAVQSFSKKELNRKWVGILGGISTQDWSDSLRTTVEKSLLVHDQIPVFLQDNELDGHYNKFCKQILWKTFHYQFPADTGTTFDQNAWTQYVNVNQKFALKLAGLYKPGDVIWINDYHLMLVPAMLRKLLPDATIGFFLHIPFPSSEIFRCLYVRKEILHGMLGADLIGFQTYSFQRHFLMTCSRLLSLESTPKGIQLENTIVSVGIFPIGIDIRALNEKR
jgi:trehalose-6-phosphate synthase